ncbi:hypothetical protein [Amycolatopsis pithecellobii]|uniref:Uncharacterized protein n=1 Tax=Amycolatopsis pithecellobii TaxID=664692 RepID=A0A6N7Z4G1_9PSEU|nr:hypothetical protein [Amycolatopsis pithecellobii]MTD57003.1 hypothetical protein [Amycolatopsis pithecellobii]
MKPAWVVFGWAGFNAVLAAIMFAYGESAEFIGMYFAAVVIVAVVGLIVAYAHGRRRAGLRRMPAGSLSAAYLALAAVLFGLGFLYTHWISYLALFPLLAAGFEFRRERLRAGVLPAPTQVRSRPLEPQRRGPVLRFVARAGVLAAVGARLLGGGRR